jgi:hypothetical protein
MHNLREIEALVLEEVNSFELPDHSNVAGLVGVPWSREHYLEEISKMRQCLIDPYWCEVTAGSYATGALTDESQRKEFAVVARDEGDGYVLCFDPERNNYALGWISDEGHISTFMYGDAVSTFLAR